MKTAQHTELTPDFDRRRLLWGAPAATACMVWAHGSSAQSAQTPPGFVTPVTHHRTKDVDGIKIFYREAGPQDAPVVLLLHGFPTSSHMFRNLIPALADRYRVIAAGLSRLRPERHARPFGICLHF